MQPDKIPLRSDRLLGSILDIAMGTTSTWSMCAEGLCLLHVSCHGEKGLETCK